ncbi:unnamed protein product [Arabidopsis lyrata]|uniref:uncharacterized protein LOC9328122 isoform X1 n=1 Tax=Arabidopsis lyrata subsp. lyrata TaxID=81972 RepID=UPI000A29AAB7|nr:uncharacterized protein LOC9328122 isoform X1 [Arabidopsis lyrata subsp. lyrata]CAH8250827.1 unnamed protein product [Arabidopsis lyrata]|eukprot:XP_020868352.1 uncharacterized protein LOC9328122 isoform X1 [Arabidopsis lyrata subsp. lyrata]
MKSFSIIDLSLQRSSANFSVGIDHLIHDLDPLCKTLAELCCGRNYRQCWLLQKHNNQFMKQKQILRTTDVDIRLPLLVHVSREKRPGYIDPQITKIGVVVRVLIS